MPDTTYAICSGKVREHGAVPGDHLPGAAAGFTSEAVNLVCCTDCYEDPEKAHRFWKEVRARRRARREHIETTP